MIKQKLKHKLLLAVLGFTGASIVFLIITHYGAGLSPDSAYYISVARNLSHKHSFIGYDGNFLVLQPPLYSVLLSIIEFFSNIDPIVSAGYFNAVLFGLIIYFSGLFLLRHLNSIVLSFVGIISILLSNILIEASLLILTELLFIFLVLLFIHFFELYRSKHNMFSLLLLSITISLACLTRYIGITFFFTGVVCILIWGRNENKEKYKHLIICLIISVLPIGLWTLRNYILSNTFLGERGPSSFSLSENLHFYITTILLWFFPNDSPRFFPIIIFITLIIWYFSEVNNSKDFIRNKLKSIGPVIIFTLLYSTFLVITSTIIAFYQISDRLLSPIYIPIIICMFYMIDRIWCHLKVYFPQRISTFVLSLSIILLLRYPVKNTVNTIKNYYKLSGYEYSSKQWRESETIKYLCKQKQIQSKYKFYSNAPEAIYILANITTHWSPGKTMYNSPEPLDTNSNFRKVWRTGDKICLVWFNAINRDYLLTIDEIKKETAMFEIAKLNDGDIYIFTKK